MPLHLIKLAVGCDSIKEFKGWIAERIRVAKLNGTPQHHIHVTRMVPKRDAELLDGGSLYWVIKGEIAVREKLLAIEPFRDGAGINRCRLVMQPKVFSVAPRHPQARRLRGAAADDRRPAALREGGADDLRARPRAPRRHPEP
jgi:hypothetical protein